VIFEEEKNHYIISAKYVGVLLGWWHSFIVLITWVALFHCVNYLGGTFIVLITWVALFHCVYYFGGTRS
jgi:hypothetical protein